MPISFTNVCSLAGAMLLLATAPAAAQRPETCDSCASCTALLAKDGANAGLSGPIGALPNGPCIVVAGAGASFDGGNHAITGVAGAAVGPQPVVLVSGADAFVRNVRVVSGAIGVDVRGANATLYNVNVLDAEAGIVAAGAVGLRLERSAVKGGRVALDLGEAAGGVCKPGATVRNPGVVVQHSRFEGAEVGISACEALPVLSGVVVTGNQVGLLLGEPKADPKLAGTPGAADPFDPCVCAPSLDGLQPESTLFYSSGCGGCEVHEGWLPEVRGLGHEVRLRETGQANRPAQDRFDAYTRRCAPAIIDAIGTPGCVPNYACVATGARFKSKGPNGNLVFDAQLNSAEQVAEFAGQCNQQAFSRHAKGGPTCVTQAIRDSRFCGNTKADVSGARGAGSRLKGDHNACGAPTEGGFDTAAIGCDQPCEGTPEPLVPNTPEAPTAAAPISPTPATAPAPATGLPHTTVRPPSTVPPPTTVRTTTAPASSATAPATVATLSTAVQVSGPPRNPPTQPNAPGWYKWAGLAAAAFIGLRLWLKFKK